MSFYLCEQSNCGSRLHESQSIGWRCWARPWCDFLLGQNNTHFGIAELCKKECVYCSIFLPWRKRLGIVVYQAAVPRAIHPKTRGSERKALSSEEITFAKIEVEEMPAHSIRGVEFANRRRILLITDSDPEVLIQTVQVIGSVE